MVLSLSEFVREEQVAHLLIISCMQYSYHLETFCLSMHKYLLLLVCSYAQNINMLCNEVNSI